jgi:hypothetical protein
MSKKALCSGGAIRSFEIEIMNDSEHLEGLFRKATAGMMKLGEMAIAALDCRGGALILGAEVLSPAHPILALGVFERLG